MSFGAPHVRRCGKLKHLKTDAQFFFGGCYFHLVGMIVFSPLFCAAGLHTFSLERPEAGSNSARWWNWKIKGKVLLIVSRSGQEERIFTELFLCDCVCKKARKVPVTCAVWKCAPRLKEQNHSQWNLHCCSCLILLWSESLTRPAATVLVALLSWIKFTLKEQLKFTSMMSSVWFCFFPPFFRASFPFQGTQMLWVCLFLYCF